MVEPPTSRRAEALVLSDELLADIELARLSPPQIARKAYRLARLLDDEDAMGWLHFEVTVTPFFSPRMSLSRGAGRRHIDPTAGSSVRTARRQLRRPPWDSSRQT
jgi:hypothetical protein